MKKIFVAITVTALLLTVLSGCKDTSSEETTLSLEETSSFETVSSQNAEQSTEENTSVLETSSDEVTENITEDASSEQITSEEETETFAVEETTKKNETEEKTTLSEENTTEKTVVIANEYDILRSGNFHIIGTMTEQSGTTSPLEMAVTPNSIFMLSEFAEDTDIGILVANGKFYMIYPAKSAYVEMNETLMSTVGFDINSMMQSEQVDFSSFGTLDEAYEVTEELYNGSLCKVYHIKDAESGSIKVYMNNDRLVRFASYSEEGQFLSSTEVYSISGDVPADRSAPPEGYKQYSGVTGMVSFMALLSDVM